MAENGGKDLIGPTSEELQPAPLPEIGETELKCGDEVSDEQCAKLEVEVSELAAKVAELREKGPKEFAVFLERSLSAFRQLPAVDTTSADDSAQEQDKFSELAAQRMGLMKRLEVAVASLPTVLKELQDCTRRLDDLIEITNQ
ncbi:hypothetical protein MPTK1_6g17570 [Marchantia polymorpha subsp. ruderalis]|uniref:Uncharacterized protein n=2 Tax=Marchantia polymorpha TaxID=3197 RepID=A0A176WEZ3_MARPO|nr:hypothetical protein AXG93_2615s1000 [Marchantia polymorpha subsp. ruderalis]PTQ29264.1 hypothetical protein MARPO_0145s0029 [Marchantia polymorpha]BBN15171.1 hypothetical protein Mp_6g17570 [Marchantia polymorpha subsp. ruderalis]|eukprot:PTQ29264.1 hypothetical protein MARPO_0145s0029 [Marchantia polymorpha]